MFDLASPTMYGDEPLTMTWTEEDNMVCSGGVSRSAVDYHHVSSVSVGTAGDLIVSSRNLNTVWALKVWTGSCRLGRVARADAAADHHCTSARMW